MRLLRHFAQEDSAALHALMRAHPHPLGIGVERLIGKWTPSQNRGAEDRDGARRGVTRQVGSVPIAAWMDGTPASD